MKARQILGYVRASTDTQDLSLEAQTAKIQQMAGFQDGALVEVIVDAGASAKSLQRRPAR